MSQLKGGWDERYQGNDAISCFWWQRSSHHSIDQPTCVAARLLHDVGRNLHVSSNTIRSRRYDRVNLNLWVVAQSRNYTATASMRKAQRKDVNIYHLPWSLCFILLP